MGCVKLSAGARVQPLHGHGTVHATLPRVTAWRYLAPGFAIVHLIEIKYCEDTRPEHQLAAAQQQHAHLCKLIDAKAVTIHPILLGVGGTCYTEHTLNQCKILGLYHQRAMKLACRLHAHSAIYAHKLVTTRRAIENNVNSNSQVPGPSPSRNPPDPH